MPKKLKVFHGLVNYGSQAGLFAKELRGQGVEAIAVVGKDLYKRQTDIELLAGGNIIQKTFNHFWNTTRKIYWFFSYNTFHFYFGRTLFADQKDLPFYKFFGKKVIMEYLGNDIRHYKTLVDRYNLPESHSYFQNMKEHDLKVSDRISNEKKYLDYKLCCVPTHMNFAEAYNYKIDEVLPLAINISEIVYRPLNAKNKNEALRILHAPTSRAFKGTVYIEKAIESIKNEGYNIDFKIVEGISHKELFKEYEQCDIFIDQISVGWYATAALESMAIGRPTCAYIDERYFKYIDYSKEIPVVNVNKENITIKLKELIDKRERLPALGKKSREFVEKYHDVKSVTKDLIKIYEEKIWDKKQYMC